MNLRKKLCKQFYLREFTIRFTPKSMQPETFPQGIQQKFIVPIEDAKVN